MSQSLNWLFVYIHCTVAHTTYGWTPCGGHEASRDGCVSSSDVEAAPWCRAGASDYQPVSHQSNTPVVLPIPRPYALCRASGVQVIYLNTSVCTACPLVSSKDSPLTVVVFNSISPPLLNLLWMSRWNPTPSALGRDRGRPLPRNEHLSPGSVWGNKRIPWWNVMPLHQGIRGGQVDGGHGGGAATAIWGG